MHLFPYSEREGQLNLNIEGWDQLIPSCTALFYRIVAESQVYRLLSLHQLDCQCGSPTRCHVKGQALVIQTHSRWFREKKIWRQRNWWQLLKCSPSLCNWCNAVHLKQCNKSLYLNGPSGLRLSYFHVVLWVVRCPMRPLWAPQYLAHR